jgi:hypothetical protein
MARISMIIGILLFGLGLGGYYGTDQDHVYSIVSAILGILLFGLGIAALKESFRKHAMHVAALAALVGFALSVYGLIKLVGIVIQDPQLLTQSGMAILCALFVGLSVKSFAAARLWRKPASHE